MARRHDAEVDDAAAPGASSRAPLYRQLADGLRADIEQGRFAAGEQLPSEPALATEAGVSRSVVRQALSELATDGLVRKGRGRRATVVAQPRYERYVSRSSGFYEQFRRRGITLETRVVRAVVTALPAAAATFFAADEGVVLDRVRRVGGAPVAYVRTYLPLDPCRALLDEDLTDRSLHEALATLFGLRVASGHRTVNAVLAPADIAVDLEVAAGDPLLLLRSEGRDQQGRPLEWFRTWHPAERIEFEIQVLADDERMVERFDAAAPALTSTAPGVGLHDVRAHAGPDRDALGALPRVLVGAVDVATLDRLLDAGVPVALDASAGPVEERADAGEPGEVRRTAALVRDPADPRRWPAATVLRTTGDGDEVRAGIVGTARELATLPTDATVAVVEPGWQLGPAWTRWVADRRPDLAVVAWDVPPDDVAAHLAAGARTVVVGGGDLDAAVRAVRRAEP